MRLALLEGQLPLQLEDLTDVSVVLGVPGAGLFFRELWRLLVDRWEEADYYRQLLRRSILLLCLMLWILELLSRASR